MNLSQLTGELKQNHFYGKFFWRINEDVTSMAKFSGELKQE